MTPRHMLIYRMIQTGHRDAEVERHVVQAIQRWDRDGGDGAALLRYLGIPTTAAKHRLAIRDFWLAAASDLAGGVTAYERAVKLETVLRRFTETWRAWRHLQEPPSHATALQGSLFYAWQAAPPPGRRRQLQTILSAAFPGNDC